MKEKKSGIFEEVGRLIGHSSSLPFSFLGLILILLGGSVGLSYVSSESPGGAVFGGLCVLAGAILQAAKSRTV